MKHRHLYSAWDEAQQKHVHVEEVVDTGVWNKVGDGPEWHDAHGKPIQGADGKPMLAVVSAERMITPAKVRRGIAPGEPVSPHVHELGHGWFYHAPFSMSGGHSIAPGMVWVRHEGGTISWVDPVTFADGGKDTFSGARRFEPWHEYEAREPQHEPDVRMSRRNPRHPDNQ